MFEKGFQKVIPVFSQFSSSTGRKVVSMAKIKSGKAPKYSPPSRLTHQAGVQMPVALINFLFVYNCFVGRMTEEFRKILEGEKSIARDVLELILMLDSKMGYYPVSVLVGMKDRDSVPKSYFARVDAIRAKTVVGKAAASLSSQRSMVSL